MPTTEETHARLARIPNLTVSSNTPLARHTRFGIGGPADLYAETCSAEAFIAALTAAHSSGIPTMVMGGGTNLIVSDRGFRGIVLRYRAARLDAANNRVMADAGAVLQDLVDFAVARGLKGLETLAGIPGSVGAAIYGNAGAYGHSISERVVSVRFYDGAEVRVFNNAGVPVPIPREHFQTAQGLDYFFHPTAFRARGNGDATQDFRRHREGAQ